MAPLGAPRAGRGPAARLRAAFACGALLVCAVVPEVVQGQASVWTPGSPAQPPWPVVETVPGATALFPPAADPWPASVSVLASGLVPGLGQALEGRWITAAAFALVEGAAWWVRIDARGDADRFRDAYRELAWTAARGGPTPRVDGPFEYYERLIHWTRSGSLDTDPALPGIQPERAADAFNGRQWRLAADIFLGGAVDAPPTTPGYAQALAYYEERAYGGGFEWDWTGRSQERARYVRLVDDSDQASRRASIALGAIVANHLLSPVEVFISNRLGGRGVELDVVPPSRAGHAGATFRVRVRPAPRVFRPDSRSP